MTEYMENADQHKMISQANGEFVKADAYFPMHIQALRIGREQTSMISSLKYGPLPKFSSDPTHLSGGTTALASKEILTEWGIFNPTDEIIDPMEFFRAQNQTEIWDSLKMSADCIEGSFGKEYQSRCRRLTSVERLNSGDVRVVLKYSKSDDLEKDDVAMADTFVFSETKGFLPIFFESINATGGCIRRIKWDWMQEEGIWLPMTLEQDFRDERGANVLHRILRKKILEINDESLPGFRGDNLPLQKGDRLYDKIEGKLFVHDGASLEEVSSSEDLGRRHLVSRVLFATLVMIAGGVFVWKFYFIKK